ncbi:MAG: hypothetical protein RR137_02215 [Odoribacter sp.]
MNRLNKKFLSVVLFGALMIASAGTFTSCKDYDDDIEGVQEQVDANKKTLDEKLATLQKALETANTELAATKTAAAAAATKATEAKQAADAAGTAAARAQADATAANALAAQAKAAAAQAKMEAITEATRLVNELKSVVDGKLNKSDYDTKMTAIDDFISFTKGELNGYGSAIKALTGQQNAFDIFKNEIQGLNLLVEFPNLQNEVAKLGTVSADLKKLTAKLKVDSAAFADKLKATSDKTELLETELVTIKAELVAINNRITAIEGNLSTLTSLLSHRLTSLTFAPTQFIDGIEVISFNTLTYKPWTILLADKSDGKTDITISDGSTEAVYYANPSSVVEKDFSDLKFLFQDATNTKAAVDPVSVAFKSVTNGKVIVNLKKNIATSLNKPNQNEFIMVALQSNLTLTAEEIANKVQPVVTSDWARLHEKSVTPFIHYTGMLELDPEAHFYNYTIIHTASTATGDNTTAGNYIIKEIQYIETLDLNTLVSVCDKSSNLYDLKANNLAFEFNLVDYALKAAGEELTNQKLFAKISKEGVISSQARNGATLNRDAIGREPLVQVVLRDLTNKKVVDVRYFKIRWTANPVTAGNIELGNLLQLNKEFNSNNCGSIYSGVIGEEKMNGVYAKLNLSKEEFHAMYDFDAKNVYASIANATAETPKPATNLGSIREIAGSGSTMTHNYEWTFPIASNPITQAEYDQGFAVRKVIGRFVNKGNAKQTCTFELTLTLKIAKMGLGAGYHQAYWNEGASLKPMEAKTFLVNPALTSDQKYGVSNFFDCQFIASMLKGYNKANVTLSKTLELVVNATDAKFVFDETRVNVLGRGWSVNAAGELLMGFTVAATIDPATGVVSLKENPIPTLTTHGSPTVAAKELVGKSVPVKLVATYCNGDGKSGLLTDVLDQFMVKFMSPLKLEVATPTTNFVDLITGGSIVDVTNLATISEIFGLNRPVWKNGQEATAGLVQWYNVQAVTWDIANAKTNLKMNGNNIIISTDNLASDWSDFSNGFVLSAVKNGANTTALKFENNSGAALQNGVTISIPVYANTKWSVLKPVPEYVTLKIQSGK